MSVINAAIVRDMTGMVIYPNSRTYSSKQETPVPHGDVLALNQNNALCQNAIITPIEDRIIPGTRNRSVFLM